MNNDFSEVNYLSMEQSDLRKEQACEQVGSVPWLLARYADGKKLCNCSRAYYSEGGAYWTTGPNGGTERHDGQYCEGGCRANQYGVLDYLAERIGEDMAPAVMESIPDNSTLADENNS